MKWLYIVGLIVYFLYNLYKKNQERVAEKLENGTPENEETTWGINDLISQFEEKYSVANEGVAPTKKVESDSDYSNFQEEVEVDQPIVIEKVTKEVDDHPKFKHEDYSQKDLSEKSKSFKGESLGQELDLENIIISSAILNRPEY